MAALATQKVVLPSLTPSLSSANAGGNEIVPGDTTFLVVKNASGAPITVTLAAYPDTTDYGAAIPDHTVSVPATTGERWIGPLRGSLYSNPTDGLVHVTYSGVTSLTVGAFTI